MEYLISRQGEQYGPYTDEATIGFLRDGRLSPADLAWHEGLDEWFPLGSLLGEIEANYLAEPSQDGALDTGDEVPSESGNPELQPVTYPASPAPLPASRSSRPRNATSWMDVSMNVAIVLLIVGGGYYYFTAGAGKDAGVKLREKARSALQIGATAVQPAVPTASVAPSVIPVPAAVAVAPTVNAVTEVTAPPAPVATTPPPVVAEATAPVVAETPAPAAAAVASIAQPTPIDWAAFSQTPALWPKMVLLTHPVEFPAVLNGEVVGSVKLPAGTSLRLAGMHGAELKLEYQSVIQDVPIGATDIELRIRAG